MLHAFVCGVAQFLGMSHAKSLQSNARQRCAAYNGGRHTSPHTKSPFPPFSPFLSVREPAVFSRRTSVAWRIRALITGGYQFCACQAHSIPARERLPAFRTELNGIERSERIAGAEKYVARVCLRRVSGFGYVARGYFQSNARLSYAAYNGGRHTSPHTKSPFNSVHSVPLRS